ncbi:MAG TPA: group I intron-associated PD-(D/E)XK endonuclease, partial [Ktedonobacteraceae bacterium]|nr:group I intron-associated PD-(D/E)XK endonuclease [Ktedonobacteraceae bacterium]
MVVSRPIPKEKGIKGALGAESEAVIAAALIQAGYTVLTPNGYMHRYDLVIEDAKGDFWKIQCKTAWLTNGGSTINFST